MFKIYINNNQESSPIDEMEMEKLVELVFDEAELDRVGEISITLTSDEEIAALNAQYRGMDSPTDVLAFAMDEGMDMPHPDDPGYCPLIGDVIISVPTAVRQADEAEHPLQRELTILLIHGILHLFGYDHDNIYQQSFMKEEEKLILEAVEARRIKSLT
jgi:probable rRNA maturation factor